MTANGARQGGRRALAILLLGLIMPGFLAAGGGKGDTSAGDAPPTIEDAERYVEAGDFISAIETLVQVTRNDPEQMERAQKLIQEIRVFQESYNAVYTDLVEAMKGDRYDEALGYIEDLEKLVVFPSRRVRDDLRLARVIVERGRNEDVLEEIIVAGNLLLAAGEAEAAVKKYREGFDLYRITFGNFVEDTREFDAESGEVLRGFEEDPERGITVLEAYLAYGAESVTSVTDLESALDTWDAGRTVFSNEADAARSAVANSEPADWSVLMSPFRNALEAEIAAHERFFEMTDRVAENAEGLTEALDGVPEEFWLPFVEILLRGRESAVVPEGILAAVEESWSAPLAEVLVAMEEAAASVVVRGEDYFDAESWTLSADAFAEASTIASSAVGVVSAIETDAVDGTEGSSLSSFVSGKEYLAAVSDASVVWAGLIDVLRNPPAVPQFDTDLPTDVIREFEEIVSARVAEVEGLSETWSETPIPSENGKVVALDAALTADILAAEEYYGRLLQTTLLAGIQFDFDSLDGIVGLTREEIPDPEEARVLIGPSPEDLGPDEVPERHPLRAQDEIITPALASLDRSGVEVRRFLGKYRPIVDVLDDPGRVEEYIRLAEGFAVEIAAKEEVFVELEEESAVYVGVARRAETNAENDLARAEDNYTDAQGALGRREYEEALILFNAALAAVEDVSEQYFLIVENDVDIAEASGIDDERIALARRIAAGSQDVSITFARNTINQVKDFYRERQFQEGLFLVLQAKTFWEANRGEANPELDLWEERLRNAEAALAQTTIGSEEPLYAEMNQYLNLSVKYYEDAVRISALPGRNNDFNIALRNAKDLLKQVTDLFPGYTAALILGQKIYRLEDPSGFNSEAKLITDRARRAVASGNQEEGAAVLPDLQALYSVDPTITGLEALIVDIEILLGLREKPKDPADIRESGRLSAQARSIWDPASAIGRQADVVDEVKRLLTLALNLDPDNLQAQILWDDVARGVGGQVTVVLDAEDNQLFRRAEDFYNQGSYQQAWALIRKLLDDPQKPQNKKYSPLLDLERKVESRI